MKVLRFWWCLPLVGVLFLVVREGVSVVPESWPSFQDALHPKNASQVDSGLFEGDSTLEEASSDTSVDAACHAAGAAVTAASIEVRSLRSRSEHAGLCSFEFRTGRPMVEQVWELSQALSQQGYVLTESNEKPLAKFCWLGRISRNGSLRAVVRARMGDKPLLGASGIGLVLWADSLPAPLLGRLESLPRDIVLALPPAALAEERVQAIAKARGFHLAMLVRLETARRPLVLQQKTRILLHHTAKEIAERLEIPNSSHPQIEGLVILDGERGAEDPQLASRVASAAHSKGWWMLDATQVGVSRLDSAARSEDVRVLPHPVPSQGAVLTLEAGLRQAKSLGNSLCSLPLDTATLDVVRRRIDLMASEGVVLRAPGLSDTSRKESKWSSSE